MYEELVILVQQSKGMLSESDMSAGDITLELVLEYCYLTILIDQDLQVRSQIARKGNCGCVDNIVKQKRER